ncbi:MAG: D-alanyl-D-alanine carboxypeptidase family protein [Lachnospiraceae bacterium]|nr:D-alanyl-D-alanine carboxypeptidase family protein [Lachnospiraceae bacterium]
MRNRKIKTLAGMLAITLAVAVTGGNKVYAADTEQVVNIAEEGSSSGNTSGMTGQPASPNGVIGWPQGPEISSAAACVLDAETGTVLYDKGMTQKMFPASTTKVMTALLAIENSSLDETVVFTETGVAEAYSGSSNLYTQVGEEFTMEECLYALLLKSANDFASQIAEHVAGSTEAFVQMMNDRAKELGCVNTHFANAHGLEHPDHYTCAYDLTLIMREAAKNETFCRIAGTEEYTISATHLTAERTVRNHNELVIPGAYTYEYCIAGKTGYTDEAMNTFVSIAEKDGRRIVEATMYSPTPVDSFSNAKLLYDYGFDNFQNFVMEDSHDLYDGGIATIPSTASGKDVQVDIGDHFQTDFGTMVAESFSYNGYPVGTASITQELYDARMEAQATPTPEPTSEPEPAVQENDGITKGDIENLDPDLKPISKELFTTEHIVIAVLAGLSLIGIIMIIVTLIRRAVQKSKKKKGSKKDGKRNRNKKNKKNKKSKRK